MKLIILFTSIVFGVDILTSCSKKIKDEFNTIECVEIPSPEFDFEKVSLIDDKTGQVMRDTLVGRIVKKREIFRPCRIFIYDAIYKDEKSNIISQNKVWLMSTGKRWEFQPEKQDEVIIQYQSLEKKIDEIKKYFVNRKLSEKMVSFSKADNSGIIENVEEVWMHPFRSNQFHFTETSAFPQVKLPLAIGKSWSNNLNIGEGWGDWENTSVYSTYEVVRKESVNTSCGVFKNCWLVKTQSTASFGSSTHDFWFNEEYGFIKMDYINYKNQSLVFELASVQ